MFMALDHQLLLPLPFAMFVVKRPITRQCGQHNLANACIYADIIFRRVVGDIKTERRFVTFFLLRSFH